MNPDSRILNFDGRDISMFNYPRYIWHGSTQRGVRESSGYCDAWRQSDNTKFGRVAPIRGIEWGQPMIGGINLLAEHALRCDEQAFILCIKIEEVRKSKRSGYGARKPRA